jgi:hypothetical protein
LVDEGTRYKAQGSRIVLPGSDSKMEVRGNKLSRKLVAGLVFLLFYGLKEPKKALS